jgi:hypothetical protein
LWSFGNNQKTYLFGKEIEHYKKSMHMAIVFEEFDETARATLGITAWPKEAKTILQKRMYLRNKIAHSGKGMTPSQLDRLQRLQGLEGLERLQRLQGLQHERLTMTALDYSKVFIKPNSLVYCDIPYRNTEKYIVEFDYQRFFDWAASTDFPVFISEYNIDDKRFKLVYTIDKKTKLSSKGMIKGKPEKLYWNGKSRE